MLAGSWIFVRYRLGVGIGGGVDGEAELVGVVGGIAGDEPPRVAIFLVTTAAVGDIRIDADRSGDFAGRDHVPGIIWRNVDDKEIVALRRIGEMGLDAGGVTILLRDPRKI